MVGLPRMGVGLAVCLAVFLLAPVMGTAADPGITDSELVLGMWTPLTGPTALLGTSERDAFEIWVTQVNAAGGLFGRKMRLTVYDDGGSPQEALAAVRRLIDRDGVFALVAGSVSGATLPVVPLINTAHIPFVASISSNVRLLKPFSPYIFRAYGNDLTQANGLIDYVVTKAGIKRPAILYTSDDYGVGGYDVVRQRLQERYHLALVSAERFNQGDQDFSAELLRIKQANPDGLIIYSFAAEAGIIVRQGKEIGLAVPLFGGGATATTLFLKAAGAQGIGFVSQISIPYLVESSGVGPVVQYRAALKKLYPSGFPAGRPSQYDLLGYGAAKIVEEGLRRAGRQLSREKFIAALETLHAFNPGVLFPVTYTRTEHEGTFVTQTIRVNNAVRWEPVT